MPLETNLRQINAK